MAGILAQPAGAGSSTLSEADFRFICKMVYEQTGIVLGDHKREMVYRRIMRRCRDLRLNDVSTYCGMLKNDGDELPNFLNAITTNLTSFYREAHHFQYMRDTFIPTHMKAFAAQRRLRIWSAACSTGEEPYTLAITVHKAMAQVLSNWDVRILATDLDTNVLQTAEDGVYKEDRIDPVPEDERRQWFKKGSGENASLVKVSERLKAIITFKQLNLLHPWPMHGPFDLIICRNVLIYFDKPTQEKIIRRFVEFLRPQGVLMLGHSESMPDSIRTLEPIGRTIFLKTS